MEAVVKALGAFLAFVSLSVGCNPERRCGLRVCDIRDAACQRRTAEAAACLRGLPTVSVPMSVISRDEYTRTHTTKPVTPAEVDRWTQKNAGLALLGLGNERISHAEAVRGTSTLYGAYYSSRDKDITIIRDPGEPLDSPYAVATLVHEYIHALQDHHGRLSHDPDDRSLDRSLTRAALVEGEASVIDDFATIALFDRDESDIPWDEVFSETRWRAVVDALDGGLPVERAHRYFSYPFGSFFVHQAHVLAVRPPEAGVGGGFEAAWASRPTTTRQVLAGFSSRFIHPDLNLGSTYELDLPASFVRVFADRMGAFVLRLFLDRVPAVDADQVSPIPGSLASDRLTIFHDPASGQVVVSWRLRFFSPAAASRAMGVLTGARSAELPFWSAVREGDHVALIASNGVAGELSALPWRAPPADASPTLDPPPHTMALCPRREPLLR